MKKKGVALVKQLLKQLSADERREVVDYLTTIPDSGFQSYDLREELAVLEKHGKRIAGPPNDEDRYLVNLLFVRNLVAVQISDTNVLVTAFFPENFIAAYPKMKDQISILSEHFQKIFTDKKKQERRRELEKHGITQTDVEFENEIKRNCDAAAELWTVEKAKRIAEQISLHLPGMVGDMVASAIKGQTFYDLHKEFQELASEKTPPSLKEFKKAVQDSAWREVKPHLPSTRHIRTHPEWRGKDTLIRFAQQVNNRKALVTCIKDMYEDCDHAEGWVEDLRQDLTYQQLSINVPQHVLNSVIRIIADDQKTPREREPLSVACEIVRRELELPGQDVETLRNYFSEGNKGIRSQRAEQRAESFDMKEGRTQS